MKQKDGCQGSGEGRWWGVSVSQAPSLVSEKETVLDTVEVAARQRERT